MPYRDMLGNAPVHETTDTLYWSVEAKGESNIAGNNQCFEDHDNYQESKPSGSSNGLIIQ